MPAGIEASAVLHKDDVGQPGLPNLPSLQTFSCTLLLAEENKLLAKSSRSPGRASCIMLLPCQPHR